MIGWETWDIGSRRFPEIRNQRRTVIEGVAYEQCMSVGKVVVEMDHAVVLINGALVIGDQVRGSVPIVCSIRKRKQSEKLWYARVNRNNNAAAWIGVIATPRIGGRG